MIRNIFSGFSRRRLGLVAVFAVVLAGGAAGGLIFLEHGSSGRPPAFRGALEPFRPNETPPAAPDVAFTDTAGHRLSLADFRGKVVLLNFWATWCVPCVEEMPSLDRLQAELGGDRFTVVPVSIDRQGLEVVKPFLAKTEIRNLAVYLDPAGASMRAFGVRGLPTTFVIDRDGRNVGRLEGMAHWDQADAKALIRYYVGPATPPRAAAAH